MIRVQSVIESILYNLDEAYNRQHSNNELIDAINSVLRYVNLSLINDINILSSSSNLSIAYPESRII